MKDYFEHVLDNIADKCKKKNGYRAWDNNLRPLVYETPCLIQGYLSKVYPISHTA